MIMRPRKLYDTMRPVNVSVTDRLPNTLNQATSHHGAKDKSWFLSVHPWNA